MSCATFSFSHFLWSISHSGRTGTPQHNLSSDHDASVCSAGDLTSTLLAHERVICKLFHYYAIPLEISDSIRATIKSKLWHMGRLFARLGGTKRKLQLAKWEDGKESTWNFEVGEREVNRQLLKRKQTVETLLEEELSKREKYEMEVNVLRKVTKQQAKVVSCL